MGEILLALLMLLLGHAAHVLSDLRKARRSGEKIGLVEFLKRRPYGSALALIGSLAGFLLLHEAGQLNLATAFGVGYIADDALDAIGMQAKGKL